MSYNKKLKTAPLVLLAVSTWFATSTGSLAVPPHMSNGIDRQILASGTTHALAVRADGTVWAMGVSLKGQRGTSYDRVDFLNYPVQLLEISGAVSVAAGNTHSLVLDQNGHVWAFGLPDGGRLGLGNNVPAPTTTILPNQIANLSGVVAIQAGADFSMAVLSDGSVLGWGNNNQGQLGDDTKTPAYAPTRVKNLPTGPGNGIVAIACGVDHTLALTSNGIVYAWGNNAFGQLGNNSSLPSTRPLEITNKIAAIAAGESFSIALQTNDTTSTVLVWGKGANYRLGLGDDIHNHLTPTNIHDLNNIWQIRAGPHTGYALDTDGSLWVWGTSDPFGLGLVGDQNQNQALIQKKAPFKHNVISNLVAIGNSAQLYSKDQHVSIAVDNSSRLHLWGRYTPAVASPPIPDWTRKTPATLDFDFDLGYSSPPQSTPVSPLAYVRGTVTNADWASFVQPLDFQKGIQLANAGEAVATTLLPFVGNLDYGYHYNSTNTIDGNHQSSDLPQNNKDLRIRYKGPIAAFGSRVGGSAMYTDQSYRFVVYGGAVTLTNAGLANLLPNADPYKDALQIDVFQKTDSSLKGTITIPIPFFLDGRPVWGDFLTNGLAASAKAYGLNTTLSPRSALHEQVDAAMVASAYGVTNSGVFMLTHNASDEATNYIFVVKMRGRNGNGWVAVSGDDPPRPVWQPLYSFEFAPAPPWTIRFLSQVQFQREPLPPFYDGMSLSELLTNSWNVTNKIRPPNGGESYTELDKSPELRSHPILNSFVDQMKHDPLALARFVQNEIELTDSIDHFATNQITAGRLDLGGINRGALGTFLERQGSPVEQCALLIYLLRQAGFQAVYAFPTNDGVKMVDVRLSKMLRVQLAGAMDPKTLTTNANSMIAVNYPWVAAYIDNRWVHLFPWIKDTEIIEGPNLYDFLPGRYDNAMKWVMGYLSNDPTIIGLGETNDTPEVLFPRYVQQELNKRAPGLSFDELGIQAVNRKLALNTFDEFPRPTWVAGTNWVAATLSQSVLTNSTFRDWNSHVLSPTIFNTAQIKITSSANTNTLIATDQLRCCDLHGRTLLAFHDRGPGGALRINLSLAGYRPDSTSPGPNYPFFANDSDLLDKQLTNCIVPGLATNIYVTVSVTHSKSTGETTPNAQKQTLLHKGDLAAICLNFGRVSREMLEPIAQTIWKVERDLKANPSLKNTLPDDQYEGPLMYLMGMSYWEATDRFRSVNQALHGFSTVGMHGIGMSKLIARRPLDDKIVYRQPAVDMVEYNLYIAELPTQRPDSGENVNFANDSFNILSIVDGSAKEHDVINKFFKQADAVSTVRLLQLCSAASGKSKGIVAINQNNVDQMAWTTVPYANPPSLEGGVYSSTYFRRIDSDMWSKIEEAVNGSPENQVICTRGGIRNSTYSYQGMGALIIDHRGNYSALISDADNGATGEIFALLILGDNRIYFHLQFNSQGYYSLDMTQFNANNQPVPTDSIAYQNANIVFDNAHANNYTPTTFTFLFAMQVHYNLNSSGSPSQLNDAYANAVAATEANGFLGGLSDALSQKFSSILDPVHSVTGEFYVDTADLSLPGPLPLEIRRNYSSLNLADNEFGIGWKLAFTPYLSVVTNAPIIYAAEADGSVLAYESTNNSDLYYPTLLRNPGLVNNRNQGIGSTANLFNCRIERQVVGTQTNYFLYGANGDVRTYKVQSYSIPSLLERKRPYLQQWNDSCGNYLLFSYGNDSNQSDFGELKRVESSNGGFVQFRYDVYGHIVEAFTGDGRTLKYNYDQFGDLVKVTLPDASEFSYEYTHTNEMARVGGHLIPQIASLHQLEKELKPDGRVLFNVYDDQHRVHIQASTVGPDLNLVTNAIFTYNNNFVLTNSFTNTISGYTDIQDVFGKITHYGYSNNLITNITDALGQKFEQTWYPDRDIPSGGYPRSVWKQKDKRGLWTEFQYDSFGNVTNMITTGSLTGEHPIGSEVSSNQAAYNANNLPIVLVDAIGNSNVIHYDAAFPFLPDQVTSYKVGIPISTTRAFYANVTNRFQNGSALFTDWFTNIACGVAQREVRAWGSPDAATNDFYYDGRGFPTNGIRYTGTSDPAITNRLFFNGRGELFQTLNGAGHRGHYDYDLLGRIKSEEVFVPGQTNPISWNNSYYNHNGEITWSDGPRYDPEDYVWRDYDGAGREIVEARWRSRAKSNGSGVEAVPGDGLYSISSFQYDPFGNLTNSVDPRGNYQVMMYDAIGQMTQQVFYAANNTSLATKTVGYEPGGKVVAATNSLGTFTLTSYTQTGLPYTQVNPDGSTNGWLYYLDGRIRKEFMPNGSYWETIYDDAHRRVTKLFRDPKGVCLLSTTNIFDRRGNVITNVDAEGAAFFATYDGLDRPRTIGGPATINGVSTQQVSRIYYDASGVATTNEDNLGRRTISLIDALQRPTCVEIRNALNNNALVWKQTVSYGSNHNSVTVTTGTGSGAVRHTSFTDTFGNSVLEQSFPSATITNFTRSTYDVAGNLLESRDELDQLTSFTYDGLNRLKSRTLPDRATVNFSYNSEGSLLGMAMPGGLTWSATYNSTNQQTFEKLTSGSQVTRQITNVYFGPGPLAGLLRQSIDLGRLVTNTYSYDVFLRLITNSALGRVGSYPEHTLLTTFQYDRQDRVTNLVQSSGVNPTTRIARKYDGYGQITSEQVYLGGALQSSFNQVWDAAGRRTSLKAADAQFDYLYRVDDRMSRVTAFNFPSDFNYDNGGLLISRSNPWRTTAVTERDLRGRPLTISTTVSYDEYFTEKLAWRNDSTLAAYTATRTAGVTWNDRRSYGYNSRGQLLTEALGLTPSTSTTVDYGFDANLLGVRTSKVLKGDLANSWKATGTPVPDGFGRITGETINQSTVSFRAHGTSVGAAEVHGTINGNPLTAIAYNPLSTDGRWSVNLSLPAAANQNLNVGSSSRLGSYSPSASSTFTTAGSEAVTDTYDDAGHVVSRTSTIGTTLNGTQVLKWDAAGRLISTTLRDIGNNGYNWTAVYDGLGRRLRTTHASVTGGTASANSQITDSFFDPQVEFQEVGVSLNGARTWKIFGPDLDGDYGTAQGLGGLDATVWQPNRQITGTIQDYFGNIPATLTLPGDWPPTVTWSQTPLNSHGPVLGYSPPLFSSGISLADASTWQGKRIEPTGFYSFGARYYDPIAGRFLSPDPLGHCASMDLYSFCDGDPINHFDPDGRMGKQFLGEGLDLSARVNNRYFHAFNVGGAEAMLETGISMERLCSWVTSPGLNTLAQTVLNGVEGAARDAFNQHTAGFNRAQGYVYAGGGFVADVLPAIIPVGGGEAGASRLFSQARNSLVERFPRLGRDLRQLRAPQATWNLVEAGSTRTASSGAGQGLTLTLNAARTPAPLNFAPRSGVPAQLLAGQQAEAQALQALNVAKNTGVWRPSPAQIDSAAFKVIVGEPQYTKTGLARGTILDSVQGGFTEIKAGGSVLESTYQLRLQVFRALVENKPLTIYTSRPIDVGFGRWLNRWGASIAPLP